MSSQGNVLLPDLPGQTGSILPLNRDPSGHLHLAVPGAIRSTVNSGYNALVGPSEIAGGRNPLTGEEVHPDPLKVAQDITGSMMGLGLSPVGGAIPRDAFASFKGWHGTPHEFTPVEHNPFGEFSDEKIGSGEGAQVYGYGHYVAGARATAEEYQRQLSSTEDQILFKGQPLDPVDKYARHFDGESAPWHIEGALDKVSETGGPMAALSRINGELADPQLQMHPADITARITNTLQKSRNWLESNLSNFSVAPNPGNLLHLEIKPDEEELLDWDKAWKDQSPAVRPAIAPREGGLIDTILKPAGSSGIEQGDGLSRQQLKDGDFTGEMLYKRLAGASGSAADYPARQVQASAALKAAGIPGIKYLDQFSRNPTPELQFENKAAKDVFPESYNPFLPTSTPMPTVFGKKMPPNFSVADSKSILDYTPEELANSRVVQMQNERGTLPHRLPIVLRDARDSFQESLEEAANMRDPTHYSYMPDLDPRTEGHYQAALDWLNQNADKYSVKIPPQTRNYVIFDPKNIRIVGKNNQMLGMEEAEGDPFGAKP